MKSVVNLTKEVFSNPTAPYREYWVLQFIKSELQRLDCPFFQDSDGNIVASENHKKNLKSSRRTALVAHTDHPGFHLLEKISGKSKWRARWFGGCPPLIQNARVAIHNPQDPKKIVYGNIVEKTLPKDKIFTIILDRQENAKRSSHDFSLLTHNCFGAFDFPGFKKINDRIFTRAADDLAGVVIILATLERLSKKERKQFLGIFTRAEETGFRGALGVIYQGYLGRENDVISLEASRQLVDARIGRGPVIRLGDKKSLFDSRLISQLDLASTNLKKLNKNFATQRRIMSGGTCEATAFNFHGIRSAGLAVPLGNYHNQRNDGTPGAEFIALNDIENAVQLTVEFYKLRALKKDPVSDFVKTLRKDFKKDFSLLKEKVFFAERDDS